MSTEDEYVAWQSRRDIERLRKENEELRKRITSLEYNVQCYKSLSENLTRDYDRMREALLSFVADAEEPPTECPRRLDYGWSDGDIAFETDLNAWVGEQIARKGLGLPYLETGGE